MPYNELQPQKVFHFFKEVNNIPRESGNEKALSDYAVEFAKKRQLEVIQDASNNVLIRKPATVGFEHVQGVIIQGHLDMVCEKNNGTVHDFKVDPIEMIVKDAFLMANGTTLGADNGIAVAMGLALLDSDDIQHPAIELLLTTDEEVGMTGALNFDSSQLKGQYFINLDSEEEGEFVVSCAGGLKAFINLPIEKQTISTEGYILKEISITKLVGGHSGVEIDKNRANANKLTGRILCKLNESVNYFLMDIHGGTKDNVITREAFMTVLVAEKDAIVYDDVLDLLGEQIANEYKTADPEISIVSEDFEGPETVEVITTATTETITFLLMGVPNGIQTMSADLPGFVESSLNLGKIAIEEDHMVFLFAIRSGIRSLKYHMTKQVALFAKQCGAEFIQTAEYPEWEFKKGSHLLDVSVETFTKLFGKTPIVKSLHAGLEPGVFLEKNPNIEAISFGPDLFGVHSPDERLHIASTERTWNFLLEVLKNLKQK